MLFFKFITELMLILFCTRILKLFCVSEFNTVLYLVSFNSHRICDLEIRVVLIRYSTHSTVENGNIGLRLLLIINILL